MAATSQKKDLFHDYEGFVDKFKPRRTTDDCMTPPAVYAEVLRYVDEQVMPLEGVEVVRPFWPGGDYENFDYPAGAVVIDNPPFSKLAAIRRFFHARGIRYFLFAPNLTLLKSARDLPGTTYIVAAAQVVYENGADVSSSFVTNMLSGRPLIRVAGDLCKRLTTLRPERGHRQKIKYPASVTSAATLGKISTRGVNVDFMAEECTWAASLDNHYGSIYGGGAILSSVATARKTAAEIAAAEAAKAEAEAAKAKADATARVITLSPRELEIIARMDERAGG